MNTKLETRENTPLKQKVFQKEELLLYPSTKKNNKMIGSHADTSSPDQRAYEVHIL
jgi:hypothetical protein